MMSYKRLLMLAVPLAGMVGTDMLLLYVLRFFSLTALGESYINLLEFLIDINISMQPDFFLLFNLSCALLIPLFFILKYVKTPTRSYEKEPALHIVTRIILYGFIFLVNFILLGEYSDLIIVPFIYFITLSVKFYEQYSLADFGFHVHHLVKNCGIGVLVFAVLEIPYLYVFFKFSPGIDLYIGWLLFVFLLTISIFLPNSIMEELIFRGYLQTKVGKVSSAGTAIIFQAVLSGILHSVGYPLDINIGRFLSVTFTMLVLGYLYYQTESLVPCIVVHSLLNGISTPFNILLNQQLSGGEWFVKFFFRVGTAAVVFVLYLYLRRKLSIKPSQI